MENTGHIKISWNPPPSGGILGPFARKTGSYVYQIFDATGRKLIGGTASDMGADSLERVINRAKGFATEKGLSNPTLEIIPH
jgi:hypothetical protein